MTNDRDLLRRARDDVGVFAETIAGAPLWPHQIEVVRSPARIRCMLTGRQAGKSRTLAVLSLHQAFTVPGSRTLIISAGEGSARDLLEEISALAQAPLLSGSVLDDTKTLLTLSNGSTVRSIPASIKQARGKSIDLLVIDEACFVDEEVWTAAKYTMIARPQSRVVMTSTPFGRADRFFAVTYRAGVAGEDGFASFHWPSTVSPLVDVELLEQWRKTSSDREYRAEVLAEWVDDAGAYYTADDIEGAVCDDLELIPPVEVTSRTGGVAVAAAGGVDWGMARDANALAVLVVDAEQRPDGRPIYALPWLVERFGMPYTTFIEEIVATGVGYRFEVLYGESNGVGQMPCEVLRRRMVEAGYGDVVVSIHTTTATKETGFGLLKMLMQEGRLKLPRHPSLLRQLVALEFETTEAGSVRISVPERGGGHDDLCMSLCQAALAIKETESLPPGRFLAADQQVELERAYDEFMLEQRISEF